APTETRPTFWSIGSHIFIGPRNRAPNRSVEPRDRNRDTRGHAAFHRVFRNRDIVASTSGRRPPHDSVVAHDFLGASLEPHVLEVREGLESSRELLLERAVRREVEGFERHVVRRAGPSPDDVEHHLHAVVVKLDELRDALTVIFIDRAVGWENRLDVEIADLPQRGEKIAERIARIIRDDPDMGCDLRYKVISDHDDLLASKVKNAMAWGVPWFPHRFERPFPDRDLIAIGERVVRASRRVHVLPEFPKARHFRETLDRYTVTLEEADRVRATRLREEPRDAFRLEGMEKDLGSTEVLVGS